MVTSTAARAATDERDAAFIPTVLMLTRRNVVRMTRMPSIFIPTLVMPLFFIITFTGSFGGISRVEGYPTDEFINWVAAFSLLQGASFSGTGAAGALANDMENGFLDRLMVSPIRRESVLVAPLLYSLLRSIPPLTIVLIASFVIGADMPGGVLGFVMVFVGRMGSALVLGAFGLYVVLRTGSFKAMNLVQMVAFMLMFPSIGQVPMALLDGWMHAVARVNPVTNLLRLTRQGFLGDVTWAQTWPGLLVLVIGFSIFGTLARVELLKRVP
jgi:ABC-2 type transport system permease protein